MMKSGVRMRWRVSQKRNKTNGASGSGGKENGDVMYNPDLEHNGAEIIARDILNEMNRERREQNDKKALKVKGEMVHLKEQCRPTVMGT